MLGDVLSPMWSEPTQSTSRIIDWAWNANHINPGIDILPLLPLRLIPRVLHVMLYVTRKRRSAHTHVTSRRNRHTQCWKKVLAASLQRELNASTTFVNFVQIFGIIDSVPIVDDRRKLFHTIKTSSLIACVCANKPQTKMPQRRRGENNGK